MDTRRPSQQKHKGHSLEIQNVEEVKSQNFLCGSRYKGQWNTILNCMDGFGIYSYPDGTEYRGFFKNGLFHGYGRVTLAAPYKLIFNGTFDAGQMVTSNNDMNFNDGLPFIASVRGENLNTFGWRYLHWVYKQTCRDILKRNVDINVRTCRNCINAECRSARQDYFKHYVPDVCAYGSAWHERKPDEMSICMSGDTSIESISCKQLADDTLMDVCKMPEVDALNDISTSTDALISEEMVEEHGSDSMLSSPPKIEY